MKTIEEKKKLLTEFLENNSYAVSGNIKINSSEGCFQQTINPGKGECILFITVGRGKIKNYQAVDMKYNTDNIYDVLQKIFN